MIRLYLDHDHGDIIVRMVRGNGGDLWVLMLFGVGSCRIWRYVHWDMNCDELYL